LRRRLGCLMLETNLPSLGLVLPLPPAEPLDVVVVTRFELYLSLRRQAQLQLASALNLCVQFPTEQQSEIRYPQPQQENDRARQGSVGPRVGREVGDVQTEYACQQNPSHDGHRSASTDPSEAWMTNVRRGPI